MKLSTSLAASAALLACLAGAPAARAQTTLTLTPAAQAGSPGSTLFFSGTLANTGMSDVFLNGDSLTFNGPANGLTLDDSPFFANAPTSLGASGSGSDTFTGGLFDVSLGASAVPGTYFGTFAVTGGAGGNAQGTLASQDFSVTVEPASPSAAPEPSQVAGLAFTALGLGGLLLRARRRKAAPTP